MLCSPHFLFIMNILSLGAGVESSAIALMADKGLCSQKLDAIIFANTGFEKRATYDYVKYLKGEIKNTPFFITSKGSIYRAILDGLKAGNKRGIPIPAFVKNADGSVGRLHRHCTQDFKIVVVEQKIREILGVKDLRGQSVKIWIGYNAAELSRIARVRAEIDQNWKTVAIPSVGLEISKSSQRQVKYFDQPIYRETCENWLAENGYIVPVKSGCKMCPNMGDETWLEMKENDVRDFEDAVKVDSLIRYLPEIRGEVFLHRTCKPLSEVVFQRGNMFAGCVGECFT